jgi:type II secretion system protein J
MNKTKGFTLIEVLLAVSLFAVIASTMYAGLYTGLRSYRRVDKSLNTYRRATLGLRRIDRDASNAFAYLSKNSGFVSNGESMQFFSALNIFSLGRSAPQLCRISYRLNGEELERSFSCGRNALSEISPRTQTILRNVKRLRFACAAPTGTAAQSFTWQQVPWPKDAAQQALLPRAVNVTLEVSEDSNSTASTYVFEEIIELH